MSEESLTLYKLMILFMLDNLDFPLTNSQLSEFFVNHGYTSYFHLQQAISELVESEFVRTETIRNTTNYHLMESGKEAFLNRSKRIFLIILPKKNTSSEKKWTSLPTITPSKRNGENIW